MRAKSKGEVFTALVVVGALVAAGAGGWKAKSHYDKHQFLKYKYEQSKQVHGTIANPHNIDVYGQPLPRGQQYAQR